MVQEVLSYSVSLQSAHIMIFDIPYSIHYRQGPKKAAASDGRSVEYIFFSSSNYVNRVNTSLSTRKQILTSDNNKQRLRPSIFQKIAFAARTKTLFIVRQRGGDHRSGALI